MQEDLQQRILSVVHEVLTIEPRDDFLDASLAHDLALSSLERMTLFVALEDEFEHELPQEEIEDIDSIRDIIEFIEAKLGN